MRIATFKLNGQRHVGQVSADGKHVTAFALTQDQAHLGAQPIITGIETQTQLDIAIGSGTNLVQGFFLARPVTAKELQPTRLFKTTVTKPKIKNAA